MSTIDTRRQQMFPRLEPREIDRLRRFGVVRRYAAGQALFVTGEIAPGMVVLIRGSVRVTRRDPLGHSAPIVEQGPGEFVAEVGQLSGQPAFVDVHAVDDVEALQIPSENLRALMIEEPELGERIMRALILRRVALVEAGAGGPVLIGPEYSPDVIRLQGFLARNAYPHQLLDPAQDRDAAELIKQYAPNPADLPLAVCPKGSILKNPSEIELAHALGMVPIDERDRTYDVAVVGAGPAGLSTAVYASSEGLSVIVFDALAFGGQAGASARIENYLGFPTGISGQALTGRAYVQAQKFGARMAIPTEVMRLDLNETAVTLQLDDGRRVKASTVVVATGARYRRPSVPNLGDFEGRGVWYWASPIEARLCSGRGWKLRGASRRLPAPLRCKNLDAGARAKSHRENVAVSHRPHRGDGQCPSFDPDGNHCLIREPGKAAGASTMAELCDWRRNREADSPRLSFHRGGSSNDLAQGQWNIFGCQEFHSNRLRRSIQRSPVRQ